MVGKYLWKNINMTNWTPVAPKLPFIAWYSKTNISFNPITSQYPEQIIINFEDVIFEEFVLPEKWCIKSTDVYQDVVINKFARDCGGNHWNDKSNYASTHYLCIHSFHNNDKYVKGISYKPSEYIEITFDQFKEYVFKESKDYSYLKQILIREGII